MYVGSHENIPRELVTKYTMEGKILVIKDFIIEDKMYNIRKKKSIWSEELVNEFINNMVILEWFGGN